MKDRVSSGSRFPSLTGPSLHVSGSLGLRLDDLDHSCYWRMCGFRHCRVEWRSMPEKSLLKHPRKESVESVPVQRVHLVPRPGNFSCPPTIDGWAFSRI